MGLILLVLGSCRSLVLEDRTPCPRFMFFDLLNGESFESYEQLFVTVYNYPEGRLLDRDTTTVRALDSQEFYMAIKGEEAVKGHGIMGLRHNRLENGVEWMIPIGTDSDPLFRFSFQAPTEVESFLVPVELVKDFAQIRVQFIGVESFSSAGGQFPFDVLVTGNTCGLDVLTGTPIRGRFEYAPQEGAIGHFAFTLPRQADHSLRMELYGRPGISRQQGLIDSFDLWAVLYEQGGISWDEKNLPDVNVVIDYKEMHVSVSICEWSQENLDYNF